MGATFRHSGAPDNIIFSVSLCLGVFLCSRVHLHYTSVPSVFLVSSCLYYHEFRKDTMSMMFSFLG